jgi:hypothetical protein
MLITSFVLASAGLGDLLVSGSPVDVGGLLAAAACICVIGVSMLWFTSIRTGGEFSQRAVAWGSLLLFSAAAIAAYACHSASY